VGRAGRAGFRARPMALSRAEPSHDNHGRRAEPLTIRIKVIVDGDEMTVDYSAIADQVKGPINSGWFGGGQTTARVAFKYLLGAGEMANEGTFRPLKLVLPPGKILSAESTAPMGNYSTPFPTVIDAVIKALEPALPGRAPGGHFGTHSGIRFHGRRADGSFFGTHDSGHGGWGACATHDGSGPFRTMAHGDTRIIPLELQETYLPVRIEEFSLRTDSGGAGTFRGGLGFRKTYRVLGSCALQTNLDRTRFPPWGVQGGAQGKPGGFTLRRGETGTTRSIEKEKGLALAAGDLVCVETGGGGGYGPAAKRALDLIQRDLDAGYISVEAAARDYGVTVGADGKAIRRP